MYLVVFLVGIAGFALLLPRLFSWRFSGFADTKKEFFQLGMWAWLYGTFALLLIYLIAEFVIAMSLPGSPIVFTLVGTATIGVFTPIANWNERVRASRPETLALSRPIVGIVLSVIIAVLVIAIISRGLAIG